MINGAIALDAVVQSRPPRQLEWRSASDRVGMMFSRFFFFLCCAGFIVALGFLARSVMWVEHGTNVPGRVIEKYETHGKSTGYHIKYDYRFDGIAQTDSDAISHSTYDNLSVNSLVQVRVYENGMGRFAKAMDPMRSLWQATTAPMVIALLALFVAGILYLSAYWYPARQRELLTWGNAARGFITYRADYRSKGSHTDLRYQFTLENGRQGEGKWTGSRQSRLTLQKGDPVTVFHMPGQAKPNMVYDVCMYRIAEQ